MCQSISTITVTLIFSSTASLSSAQSVSWRDTKSFQDVGQTFNYGSEKLFQNSNSFVFGNNALAVATGGTHTCALTAFGGVKCWGFNASGQLGDLTNFTRSSPVDVIGLASGIKALAAGDAYTCALTDNHGVLCWGNGSDGQLGNGLYSSSNVPVDVAELSSGVTAMAAGYAHACAVTNSGGVMCWGNNAYGQLWDGTTTNRSTPVDVIGLASGVVALTAGGDHTCALMVLGGVKCWGENSLGQLGDGIFTDSSTPVDVTELSSGVGALAAGYYHTCAVTASGGVKCWGANQYGQLGDGTPWSRITPVDVVGLSKGVTALAAGYEHTCALTTSSGLKCWGDNEYGQLGDGTTVNNLTPVQVAGPTYGTAVLAAGGHHTCAITAAGGVKCWGANFSGQLGDGTTDLFLFPADVIGLSSGVKTLAAGSYHTCALTTSGGVKCWGWNNSGQLGDGTYIWRSTPVDVAGLSSGALALDAGIWHTCALTSYGGVKCWGSNSNGRLGGGTAWNHLTLVEVVGLSSGVRVLAAGINHTCAVTASGTVKCWGKNDSGQLGDGTFLDRDTPVDVIGLTGSVVALAGGGGHTCALTASGAVMCWSGSSPTNNVSGLTSGVTALTAGGLHTCALTAAGGVKCWGHNYYGQLGDSTTTDRSTPVDVIGLSSGVVALAAGEDHTCALIVSGGVKCWGDNEYGQLGDGTTTDHKAPVDVVGLSNEVTALAAGGHHTCALTNSGGVKCWGDNSHGQLGYKILWVPRNVIGFEGGFPGHKNFLSLAIWR
jgi:alpha-tubulin suppressor-like RCC1 family protein